MSEQCRSCGLEDHPHQTCTQANVTEDLSASDFKVVADYFRDALAKAESDALLCSMTNAAAAEQASVTLDSLTAASIAVDSLMRTWDRYRPVLYVHPADLLNPLLEPFRKNGYQVESRETMPAGIAFWKDFETCGIVYFDRGTFLYYENPERKWEKQMGVQPQ